ALAPTDGLQVTAWPVNAPPLEKQARATAVATPSGALAFHALPGLREFERSAVDDPWDPRPPTRKFQVEVVDPLGRFLPCRFSVSAPHKGLDLFADNSSPPLTQNGAVPLFSAPTRPIPAGLAVVRAELHEVATGRRPASWGFVEAVYFSGGVWRIARGMADRK